MILIKLEETMQPGLTQMLAQTAGAATDHFIHGPAGVLSSTEGPMICCDTPQASLNISRKAESATWRRNHVADSV